MTRDEFIKIMEAKIAATLGTRRETETCAFCKQEFRTANAHWQRCVCNECLPGVKEIEANARRNHNIDLH